MATKALNYTAAEINQRLNLAGIAAQTSAANQADIAELKSKADSISKQSTQSEEEAIIYETDGGVQIGKIDANGADFANLKLGGQQVARMSDLPTKDTSIGDTPSQTNVPTSKAVADYVKAHGGGSSNDIGVLLAFKEYGAMEKVEVKKDGTGDYLTIQEAINAITDASPNKQYDIQVFDDFEINDLKDLWLANAPTYQNSSDSPSNSIALVITKDWVHIRGIGKSKKLSVESPNINMTGSCFKNIQVLYPRGCCIINNFDISIKGGRYAIHQESGGSSDSQDYMATTVYKDLKIRHKGNSAYTNGSSWTTECAQANGTSSGLRNIYINCHWYSDNFYQPFYVHAFPMSQMPNRLIFINCSVDSGIADKSTIHCYFGGGASCQNNIIEMYSCDFKSFDGLRMLAEATITDTRYTDPYDKHYVTNTIIGFGNKKHRVSHCYFRTLKVTAKNNGDSIDVIGGSAKELIFGNSWIRHSGVANSSKGFDIGDIHIISGTHSHANEIPYLLGNCASSPKTLVVRVTHSDNSYNDITVTFDENYMTSDGSAYTYQTSPAISMEDIISSLNSEYSSYFSFTNLWNISVCLFGDTKEIGRNSSNVNISMGSALVRDYANGMDAWRLATANETPEGINCMIIAPNESCDIALIDRSTFSKEVLGLSNISAGQMYKWNGSSWIETSIASEAVFIALGSKSLIYKNKEI